MSWNEVDVYEERIRFAVAAERREYSMATLCREFGISRATGYKWWRRYRAEGVTGLSNRSRRPHRSPLRLDTCGVPGRAVCDLRARPKANLGMNRQLPRPRPLANSPEGA